MKCWDERPHPGEMIPYARDGFHYNPVRVAIVFPFVMGIELIFYLVYLLTLPFAAINEIVRGVS